MPYQLWAFSSLSTVNSKEPLHAFSQRFHFKLGSMWWLIRKEIDYGFLLKSKFCTQKERFKTLIQINITIAIVLCWIKIFKLVLRRLCSSKVIPWCYIELSSCVEKQKNDKSNLQSVCSPQLYTSLNHILAKTILSSIFHTCPINLLNPGLYIVNYNY